MKALLLSFKDAAALLGVSRALLYQLHSDGRLGPRPHKLGKRSLLRRDELESWVEHNMPPRVIWEKIWAEKTSGSQAGNNNAIIEAKLHQTC